MIRGDPCPDCEEPMAVQSVTTKPDGATMITWQVCADCDLGWGPFSGYVDIDDEPEVES